MEKTKPRAVYEVVDPLMDRSVLLDGRGGLKHPAVVWAKAHNGWKRCSPVVELSLAKRLGKQFAHRWAISITPATQISKTINLPTF